MRVNLAVQVLSHSVAAGMKTLVELKKLPTVALQTAQFAEKFNTLVDYLNSSSIVTAGQKCAISIHFWAERRQQLSNYLQWVESWKFVDQRPTCKQIFREKLQFQTGLTLTISAVRDLVERLLFVRQYNYVSTRRFGQDCVENLFSNLRRDRGGFNSHPEASKAIQNLRFACCGLLFDYHKTQNCEDAGGDLLLHIGKVSQIFNFYY
jgi:hypothetical protein